MKLLSLKESDERKLYEWISQLKALHQKLVNQYSLKSDLQELTDRRFTLRGVLEDELDIIRKHQQDLVNKSNELTQLKTKLESSLTAIQEAKLPETILKAFEAGIEPSFEVCDSKCSKHTY